MSADASAHQLCACAGEPVCLHRGHALFLLLLERAELLERADVHLLLERADLLLLLLLLLMLMMLLLMLLRQRGHLLLMLLLLPFQGMLAVFLMLLEVEAL